MESITEKYSRQNCVPSKICGCNNCLKQKELSQLKMMSQIVEPYHKQILICRASGKKYKLDHFRTTEGHSVINKHKRYVRS